LTASPKCPQESLPRSLHRRRKEQKEKKRKKKVSSCGFDFGVSDELLPGKTERTEGQRERGPKKVRKGTKE
jgi:hypothetical protein